MKLKRSYTSAIQEIIGEDNRRHMMGEKTAWTTFFKDENDILNVFKELSMEKIVFLCHYNVYLIKGTEYIIGFKTYFNKNHMLTDKQITQCKRIALELYKLRVLKDYIIDDSKPDYELPDLELSQDASGYVRGYYEFDDARFNMDLKEEIKKEGLMKKEEVIAFAKKFAKDNYYVYRGDFIEVRDDKTTDELIITVESTNDRL